jgi:hypothetical protein
MLKLKAGCGGGGTAPHPAGEGGKV